MDFIYHPVRSWRCVPAVSGGSRAHDEGAAGGLGRARPVLTGWNVIGTLNGAAVGRMAVGA